MLSNCFSLLALAWSVHFSSFFIGLSMQWLTVRLGIQPCTTHKVWVKRLLLLALPDPNIDRVVGMVGNV